jgi:hypothetical protein|tara:strand:- start:826 stop:1038 length:213 start_codon:yes stop_codon:yes gene_type:complete
MILEIERTWNRDPGWFYSLPKPTQIQLIANHRIDVESPKQAQERQNKAKRARLDKMRQKATRTGAVDHGQ